MKTSQKALANSLRDLLKKGMNQNQIASLARVSPATISELINHKREFSERLVKVVSERIRVYAIGDDLAKDVKQYKMIWSLAKATQREASFSLITGDSGLSKSSTLKDYTTANKNVYYIKIDRRFSWNQLLMRIANEMGLVEFEGKGKKRKPKRLWSYKILDRIIQSIEQQQNTPLLIIDEAEILSPSVLKNFKSLYVATEDLLGIIICGISSLNKKIAKLAGLTPNWQYQKESNEYTTFARRLKRFAVPRINKEDWQKFLKHFKIQSEEIANYAMMKWWNYDEPNFIIRQAQTLGIKPEKMQLNDIVSMIQ